MGILDLISIIPNAFRTVDNITNAISNERIAKINAGTEEERIAADERIKALDARRSVLIAESGARINMVMRVTLAAGPASFLLKVFLYDKVIGSLVGCAGSQPKGTCTTFVTDPLDANLWGVITAVIGFYFLYELGARWKRG